MTRRDGRDSAAEGTGKSFYPDYLAEIVTVVFVVYAAALLLALFFPPALGREIDLSAQYRPLPEWYFLWLYQLVRYFPGRTVFVGAVFVPAAAFAALLVVPFMDRGQGGRVTASIAAGAVLLLFVALTAVAVAGR